MQTYTTPEAEMLRNLDGEREHGKHRNLEHYGNSAETLEVYCSTSEREAYELAGYDIDSDEMSAEQFAHFLAFLTEEFDAKPI